MRLLALSVRPRHRPDRDGTLTNINSLGSSAANSGVGNGTSMKLDDMNPRCVANWFVKARARVVATNLLRVTDSELYYWSTIAQLIPVLGLALVVEIRAISDARARVGAAVSTFAVVMWALVGIGMVFALITALSALQADKAPSAVAEDLSEIVVSAAVALVVGNPIMYFLTARGSKFLSLLVTVRPTILRNLWALRRKIRLLRRNMRRNRHEWFGLLAKTDLTLEDANELIGSILQEPRPWTQKTASSFEKVSALREDVSRRREAIRVKWWAAVLHEINMGKYTTWELKQVLDKVKQLRTAERRTFHEFVRSLDSTGSFRMRTMAAVIVEPDDGGFFPAPNFEWVEYEYRELPYVATGIEDFLPEGKD